jgi:hypothetical protein
MQDIKIILGKILDEPSFLYEQDMKRPDRTRCCNTDVPSATTCRLKYAVGIDFAVIKTTGGRKSTPANQPLLRNM